MFAFVILPYVDQKPAKLSGQEAPNFDLELLSGGAPGDRVRLSDLRGKIVVLDFWASWCRPCKEQSQVLSAVSSQLPKDVYLLGISTSDQRPAAEAFLKAENLPYANAFDEGGEVGGALHITQLPTLVVLDRSGVIVAAESRVLSAAEVTELISTLRNAS
jgi:peroxiredoxin